MSDRGSRLRGDTRGFKRKSKRELREMKIRNERYGGPRPETDRNLNQGFLDAGDPGRK